MAFDTSAIRMLVDETPREEAERLAEIVLPMAAAEAAKLPSKVLLPGMSAAQNQGKGYYCASFATVALLEFKFPRKDLAECSLIKNVKQNIGELMNFALQRGVCGEAGWPYHLKTADTKPCDDRGGGTSFSFGKTYLLYREQRAASSASPSPDAPRAGPKSDPIRRHLATVATPVIIDLPALFAPDWQCGWEDGDIFCPRMLDRDKAIKWANANKAWHAVALHGYDDATQTFALKNSWGTGWGRAGFGSVGYLYVDQLSSIGMAAE